ncbi:MAG: hypothetical protein ACYS26_03675 [Planctomycetota bacterium]|jgi:hypothetical protein
MKRLLLYKVTLRQTMWAFVALAAVPVVDAVFAPIGGCPCRMPVPLGGAVELEPADIVELVEVRGEQLEELFALYCETIHDVRHHEHEPEWFSGSEHLALRGDVSLERVELETDELKGTFARFAIDGELVASLALHPRSLGGSHVHASGSSYLCRLAARRAFESLLATGADPVGPGSAAE